MSSNSTTTLVMTKNFGVTADKVFNAWLNPEMMKKWFFTMEHTNKVTKNEPHEGGWWEIVDHRDGKDYRAIGEYIEVSPPNKLVMTFEMPQFSNAVDEITVELKTTDSGSHMSFTQVIVIPHEEGWTDQDIEKAQNEYKTQSEQGWGYMFEGLKQLVETGKINYPF